MSMKKTIVVQSATVYGPTDYSDTLVACLDGKTVYRSDYLSKLDAALKAKDPKYAKGFKKLVQAALDGAVGYDADHPYVTIESRKARAWRYVAVVD